MINKLWTGSILLFCPMSLQAQNWLPDRTNAHQEIRLLDCRYHEEKLKSCEQLTDTSSCWRTSVEKTEVTDGTLFVFRFKALKNLTDAGVAVAFDRYHWTSDNYVMIPASVYNGNRQRIVNRNYATGLDPSDYDRPDLALTSNPIPQLSPDFGSPSRLEVSVCNAATPAIAFLDRQKKEGVLLLTDQGIVRDGQVLDHGLIVELRTTDRHVLLLENLGGEDRSDGRNLVRIPVQGFEKSHGCRSCRGFRPLSLDKRQLCHDSGLCVQREPSAYRKPQLCHGT